MLRLAGEWLSTSCLLIQEIIYSLQTKTMLKLMLALSMILLFATYGFAQTGSSDRTIHSITYADKDSISIIADPGFKRKGQKRWLLGNHYRQEWVTPVRVPIVYPDTLFGGVTVLKEGGGKQTKSIHLQLNNDKGKQYVLRSVEKFPDQALPPEFRGTIASSFVKDQISSAHPYAPLVIAYLAEAAGIYHTNPRFIFLPHSKALGTYDSLFGEELYLLEERPSDNWKEASFFGNSEKIYSTEKMRALLLKSPSYKIDEAAFLRSRLLDILIGDWDRHDDQWAWASIMQGEKTLFKPIPKDRDQAFANLDGVIPWVGRRKWALRRAQHFDMRITDVKGLVWSGRNMDREFLTGLQWRDWQNEVNHIQGRLTDDVIKQAVLRLPPELYGQSGEVIIQKLLRRRDDLLAYARKFYEALAEEVEIRGTANSDQFVISNDADTSITVIQYAVEDTLKEIRKRTFLRSETKEVRIYGLDGEDEFETRNAYRSKIKLRFIDADGANQYTDNRNAKSNRVWVYDTSLRRSDVTGNFKLKRRFDSLTHQYAYNRHQYSVVTPVFLPGYNSDDGVFIGGGFIYKKTGWGSAPYKARHYLAANYAFSTSAYNFLYEGIFSKAIGAWDLVLEGRLNQPNHVLNFYGLGNNTELITRERSFNRVRVRQVSVFAGLQNRLSEKSTLRFNAIFLSTRVESINERFVSIGNKAFDSADFDRTNWFGGSAQYFFDTRDNHHYPSKGWYWQNTGQYLYSSERKNGFVNGETSLSLYLPIGKLVYAARVGGAHLWGHPQFFQYNQLSGLTNLRGYRRSRFSGTSMVYQNNELRIPVADIKSYLLAGKFGFSLFGDQGRVWIDDEKSSRWHVGYGAGVWIIPFERASFTASYARSKEDQMVLVRTGFLF
jgi:hypothetical protein